MWDEGEEEEEVEEEGEEALTGNAGPANIFKALEEEPATPLKQAPPAKNPKADASANKLAFKAEHSKDAEMGGKNFEPARRFDLNAKNETVEAALKKAIASRPVVPRALAAQTDNPDKNEEFEGQGDRKTEDTKATGSQAVARATGSKAVVKAMGSKAVAEAGGSKAEDPAEAKAAEDEKVANKLQKNFERLPEELKATRTNSTAKSWRIKGPNQGVIEVNLTKAVFYVWTKDAAHRHFGWLESAAAAWERAKAEAIF